MMSSINENVDNKSNLDSQPLSNNSNTAAVIKALNQLGNTCTAIANENRELWQEVSSLNARVESLDQFIRECIPSIVQSQDKTLKKLSKCMSLFNLPDDATDDASGINNNRDIATDNDAAVDTAKRSFDGVAISQSKQSTGKTLVDNCSYKRQRTNLEDIVMDAYYNEHFDSGGGWSFTSIQRDEKFLDKAKFERCLQLLDVAVTDDKKRELEETGLDATTVVNVANSVAKMAMKRLLELEGKSQPGKQTTGYTGVGVRVKSVMTNKYFIEGRDKATLAQAISKHNDSYRSLGGDRRDSTRYDIIGPPMDNGRAKKKPTIFTEDKLKNRAKFMHQDWMKTKNEDDLLYSMDEILNSPNAGETIVRTNTEYAIEAKAPERAAINEIIAILFTNGRLQPKDVQSGMLDVFELIEAFVCDSPGFVKLQATLQRILINVR